MKSELSRAKAGYRVFLTRGTLVAACGILAAACGSAAAPAKSGNGGSTSSSAPTSPGSTSSAAATSAAKVSLNVLLTGAAGSKAKHWTLQCEPAGGNFPDATAACTKLLKLRTIFSTGPGHIMCPMIMADARTYIISGTFLGKQVHESIVDGGCQLSRWGELNRVFN